MKHPGFVAVASVGLVMVAVGCASSSTSTTPAQTPSPSTTPSTPSASKAGIGDTIDLSDSTTGKKIAVTVVKVVDPDSPSDQFATPPSGDRFESVQFRIVNMGTATYQDDPLFEITARDAAGQSMQQDAVPATAAGTQMPSAVSLAPGDTALGFVTFDVPSGDRIAQAQYSLGGGFGATGEWQIGNGQPVSPSSASPTATTAPPPSPTTTAPSTPPPTASGSTSTPQAVVEQYFAAITAHNYALAWALGGKNLEGGSYDQFVQGFATTSSDAVTIVSTSGDTVTMTLDATQTDGSHKYFAGTYTVVNGVIVAADVH